MITGRIPKLGIRLCITVKKEPARKWQSIIGPSKRTVVCQRGSPKNSRRRKRRGESLLVKETVLINPEYSSVMTMISGFSSFNHGRRPTMSIPMNSKSSTGGKVLTSVDSRQIVGFSDIHGIIPQIHRCRLLGAASSIVTAGDHSLSLPFSVRPLVDSGHYATCLVVKNDVLPFAMSCQMTLGTLAFRFSQFQNACRHVCHHWLRCNRKLLSFLFKIIPLWLKYQGLWSRHSWVPLSLMVLKLVLLYWTFIAVGCFGTSDSMIQYVGTSSSISSFSMFTFGSINEASDAFCNACALWNKSISNFRSIWGNFIDSSILFLWCRFHFDTWWSVGTIKKVLQQRSLTSVWNKSRARILREWSRIASRQGSEFLTEIKLASTFHWPEYDAEHIPLEIPTELSGMYFGPSPVAELVPMSGRASAWVFWMALSWSNSNQINPIRPSLTSDAEISPVMQSWDRPSGICFTVTGMTKFGTRLSSVTTFFYVLLRTKAVEPFSAI